MDPVADRIAEKLQARYPNSAIRMRETGRYIHAVVSPRDQPNLPHDAAREIAGEEEAWRLAEVALAMRDK